MSFLNNSQSYPFFNYNYDSGILFDEKNKRFVDMRFLDKNTKSKYSQGFMTYRPDLWGTKGTDDNIDKFKIGKNLLGHMYLMRLGEIARSFNLFQASYFSYCLPLHEHHLKLGHTDYNNLYKIYYWDDATKIVNYLDYVTKRINKYGLHWGVIDNQKFDGYKEQIKKDEDELTNYFLFEMRKPPTEKEREYSKMHI